MSEPNSFDELEQWLERMSEASGCPHILPEQFGEPHNSPGGYQLPLIAFSSPHLEAIEQAARDIAIHEEAVFVGLQPAAGSLLRLRIEHAHDLISELLTTPQTPILYPSGEFRELVQWLLIDWWEYHGRNRAQEEFHYLANQ